MLGDGPFLHWPVIIFCALLFALLFEGVVVLGELVLTGTIGLTWTAIGFAVFAFFGYIAVAYSIKRTATDDAGRQR